MKSFSDLSSFPLLVAGLLLIIAAGCKKENNDPHPVNGQSTAIFNPDVSYGTLTDRDGNIYKTVTIGTQTWMAENLRTTKYNDGSNIPHITDSAAWSTLSTGAYCNYNNDESIVGTYGRLYNWYVITDGQISPTGWHVSDNEEWAMLNDYLGGHFVAGGHLKEAGTSHWREPNVGADNSTGFTALPGGYRYDHGGFNTLGEHGYWWSSSDFESNATDGRNMHFYDSYLYYFDYYKKGGFSIRCVKDEVTK